MSDILKDTKHFLRNMHSYDTLEKNPLIQFAAVTQYLADIHVKDTPVSRAIALTNIVEQLIENGVANRDHRSFYWMVLQELVLKDKKQEVLAREEGYSLRSLSRYYRRACSTLAGALMDLESRSGSVKMTEADLSLLGPIQLRMKV